VKTLGYDGTLKFDTSIDSSGFQDGISKIGSCASTALKATTAIIGGAATAVVGIGTAAIKTGANFESSMSNVAAISGATGDELKSLTDKAKEMGAKTKFSASESADAFSYMAMAGWKTADMLDGIEGIMNLAAASGEDLATTSDIVTDALTAFGLSASDSTHFADILAKASSNANTNVGMMGETFKYVAPVAGALGFSAEDCATAIGLMANSGIKASQAGTSLRSIFTRMAKPTKEVQGAMDALGISLTKSDGSMKSLNEIMVDLRKGFSGLTQDQKAQMAAALGGQEAMSGLLAIVNASDDDFNKLSDSIANCDGAAADMAETMNDNLSGQITILKSGLEGLAISLYEEMQTPLKDIVKEAQTMVQGLQEAFNDGGLDSLVTKAGEVMAQIVTEVAQAAPKLIGTAENLVGSFIQGIVDHKSEFAAAGATMVAELVRAITDVAGDMWSAGIYLFTEFLQAMTDHSEEMGQSFGEMISKIGEAVQTNLPLIIQAAKDFVAGFCEGLSEEFPGVSALIEGFLNGFIDTASTIIQGIVDVVSDLFSVIDGADPNVLEAVGYAIGVIAASIAALSVASSVLSSVKSLFKVLGTLKGGVSGLVGVIGKVVEGFALWKGGAGTLMEVLELEFPKVAGIFSSIGGAVQKVIGFFAEFGSSIAGIGSIIAGAILAVTNFVDMFVNGFSAIKEVLMVVGIALASVGAVILGAPALVAAAVAGIVAAVATAVVLIKEHWDQIVEFFKSIPEKLSELGSAISEWFSGVLDSIGEFIDSAVEWFSELPGKIIDAINSLAESFVEWGASMLETASEVVSQIIDSIVQFFTDLPYKIGYAIGFVIGTLIEWGANVINWITTNVPQMIDSIIKFFSELPGKIWNWLVNTYNKLVEWGSQMLQKAGEIASNCIDNIVKFFSELPGKIWNWLTDAFNKLVTWGSNTLQKAKEIASNTIDAIVNFFSQLPGKIWTWLSNTLQKVIQWGSDMVAKGRQAASDLCSAVINGVANLPSQMANVGYNIVMGVWNGICNAAGWFRRQVQSFFSGIVDGVKGALGIHSPSKVFADEIGKWIPPGIGVGIEAEMPDLYKQMDDEMASLGKRMQTAVNVETGKIAVDKKVSTTYKVEKEKQGVFESGDTTVEITGETHVHVDLDGREVGDATTPIVDENMARIDTHKKRGG
jgi:TP901 family phage tail tape measure protein